MEVVGDWKAEGVEESQGSCPANFEPGRTVDGIACTEIDLKTAL